MWPALQRDGSAPAFDPRPTATDNPLVDNLGANLWKHSEEGKTASIRAG